MDNLGASGNGPCRTPPRHGPDGNLEVNIVSWLMLVYDDK